MSVAQFAYRDGRETRDVPKTDGESEIVVYAECKKTFRRVVLGQRRGGLTAGNKWHATKAAGHGGCREDRVYGTEGRFCTYNRRPFDADPA